MTLLTSHTAARLLLPSQWSGFFIALMISTASGQDLRQQMERIASRASDGSPLTLTREQADLILYACRFTQRDPQIRFSTSPADCRILITEPAEYCPSCQKVHEGSGYGSGVSIRYDGTHSYVLTAAHNVRNATGVRVQNKDGTFDSVEVLARDPAHDVALLKVEGKIPYVKVAEQYTDAPYRLRSYSGIGSFNERRGSRSSANYQRAVEVTAGSRPGDSGGGVFQGEELVGIISGSDHADRYGRPKTPTISMIAPLSAIHHLCQMHCPGGVCGQPGMVFEQPRRIITNPAPRPQPQPRCNCGPTITALKKQITNLEQTVAQLQIQINNVPAGPAGPPGPEGPEGPQGPPAPPSPAPVLTVIWEAGDDPDEPARVEEIPIYGGELRIPPQSVVLRQPSRDGRGGFVMDNGSAVLEQVTDKAPLGQPIKFRNDPNRRTQ